jgi:hypothetical protein
MLLPLALSTMQPALLAATLLSLLVLTEPSNEYLEQWYSLMSDPNHECTVSDSLAVMSSNVNANAPLFTLGECGLSDGARWDYNFASAIKTKNGAMEGKGSLVVPVRVKRDFRPEHNNFKFGFKYNKCIKLASDDISRIQVG